MEGTKVTLLAGSPWEGGTFLYISLQSTLKCLHDRQGHPPPGPPFLLSRVTLLGGGYLFLHINGPPQGHPAGRAISVDLKIGDNGAKMQASKQAEQRFKRQTRCYSLSSCCHVCYVMLNKALPCNEKRVRQNMSPQKR